MCRWARLGLIGVAAFSREPEYIDPRTGYRYYGAKQFEVLNTIRYLRVLDMPLTQIAEFLHNRDVACIKDKLVAQERPNERKQHELEMVQRKIDHRLERLRTLSSPNST